jgi:hypothetical protein
MFGMGGFRNDGRGPRDAKRVQPCGDGAGGGVATDVSLRVPENSLDLGRTDPKCERSIAFRAGLVSHRAASKTKSSQPFDPA